MYGLGGTPIDILLSKEVDLMLLPDKFPPGCKFLESEPGAQIVVFPDGRMFAFSERTGELVPGDRLPMSEPELSTEEAMRAAAAQSAAARSAAK